MIFGHILMTIKLYCPFQGEGGVLSEWSVRDHFEMIVHIKERTKGK